MKKMKIIITGGGTGGHTSPAISIIKYLRKHSSELNTDFNFLYVGSKHGIEKTYADKEEVDYKSINTGKLRRSLNPKNIIDAFKVLAGLFQSLGIVKRFKPDVVFSTGGYVSVPIVIASSWKNIPTIIHEQTVNVGLANKIASKFADKVALTFESSAKFFPKDKTVVTGIPLREEIFSGEAERVFQLFPLEKGLPLLYITGGSQGSKFINDSIKAILPDLLAHMNIIHQCGGSAIHDSYDELKTYRTELPEELQSRYVVRDYIFDELPHIFKASHLIVGRSGAGTVNECIALGKPSLFIPLPGTTRDEQGENARLAESLGGAEVMPQDELTPERLLVKIKGLILDKDRLAEMKFNFLNQTKTDGNLNILNLILEYAKK
jgi:UDP-N-acetylglucosamine--N-acetylmuramyl-(pentapeptide) pyrophosphoryl-undecaprenol N-acetylglucosamine transferase